MSFNSKYTGAQVEAWLDNIKNYSANDILEKLKTVDGSNSGLDADLLDGKHLNDILASNVASATKLDDNSSFTAWGQTFFTNGKPQSVNGSLSGATTINSVLKPYRGDGAAAYLHMTNINANPWAYVHLFVSNENLGNTSRALILQNGYGNVGIGLSDPQYKLDVGGSARFSSICTISSSNTTSPVLNIKSETGNVDYIHLFVGSNSGTHTNTRPLVFQNGYGNVGIGTTNPSYKLEVSGSIHASGSITQNSDINLKNISKDILISLDDISEAPLFEFTYKNDKNKRIHVGTSAQYWVEKNNWFCKKQDNGYYDMEIQNLALASAISIAKEFKKYKEETESTISNMKKEIEELKQIVLNMNK